MEPYDYIGARATADPNQFNGAGAGGVTEPDHAEIHDLMERYFEGLYQSDSATLRTVFHNDLAYVNGTAGTYEHMDLENYMARIDARTSPASRGERREEVIEHITLKGDRIGLVEARMTMLGLSYQDLLTLIHTDKGWRVLTKVFSFVERKD